MSAVAASGSEPSSLAVSALPNHAPVWVAPGKSRKTSVAPALPRTAEVAVQVRASQVASTRMVTVLVRVEPHLLAAAWNAFRRCWPSVVPTLPPTGATAVESLKPTPAGSPFTMVIVAAPHDAAAPAKAETAIATAAPR